MLFRCTVVAVAACLVQASAAASGFLAPGSSITIDHIVENLRALLGHEGDHSRLEQLTSALRPTYTALPRDDLGGLSHRVARFALHRYFIVQHAWYIKGLALEQDARGVNETALTGMLKSKMPSVILEVLEQELHGKVIGLEELAVLAATIEDLVHSDAVDLLSTAYTFNGLSVDDRLGSMDAETVIKTFSLFFLMPDLQVLPPRRLKQHLGKPERLYPGWEDAWLWIKDLRNSDLYHQRAADSPFASRRQHSEDWEFPAMARWAQQITAGIGRFSDLECKTMRNTLLDLEDEGTMNGRVRLGRFYGPVLEGTSFHFSESPDYLRHLGALDETDPSTPSVIVPNVLYARSNCLATSGFHSVCCVDDCEVLMTHLEEKLATPLPDAREVLETVATIPSESVPAPRTLSVQLVQRLDAIAQRHGGRVPLHGRLFSQWMHYAFPNECRHPSSSAEVPMTTSEWRDHWNKTKSVRASKEEMLVHHTTVKNATIELQDAAPILWSDDEELLSDPAFDTIRQTQGAGVLRSTLRLVAMVAATIAGIASLLQNLKSAKVAVWEATGTHGAERPVWCEGLRCPGSGMWSDAGLAREDTKAHFV